VGATVTPSESSAMRDLRLLILSMLPDVTVIRGLINRVPEPSEADFIVIWPLRRTRLATNVDSYQDDVTLSVKFLDASTQLDVQCDVHGPRSGECAQIVSTMLRDDYACQFFERAGSDTRPLYASDPVQALFFNAENQGEERWRIELSLQIAQVVQAPQEFFDELTLDPGLINVDAVYPPV
jgi:hypothetical protein